jgi:hypothetical protein
MKTKVFTVISILTILSLLFNSCRKGEDDPWISLRTRNNRIIGKWKLEEYTYEKDYDSYSSSYNNINTKTSTQTKDTTISESFSSGILTENSVILTEFKYNFPDYEPDSNVFISDKITDYSKKEESLKYKYEISLEIKKDYTWIAHYTKSKYSYRIKTDDIYIKNSDTLSSYPTDTLIEKDFGTKTWTENGYWNWVDSKKNKIVINAGPMKGYLKRLSNKEIIIEETDNYNSSSTNYRDITSLTYDDINNPYNEADGIRTSNTNININKKIYYKWIAE